MELRLLAQLVGTLAQLLILLVFINSILSFIISPYHPIKEALDRLVNPLLAPIRRILPTAGMFDFSPLILIILIQILSKILISILRSL